MSTHQWRPASATFGAGMFSRSFTCTGCPAIRSQLIADTGAMIADEVWDLVGLVESGVSTIYTTPGGPPTVTVVIEPEPMGGAS